MTMTTTKSGRADAAHNALVNRMGIRTPGFALEIQGATVTSGLVRALLGLLEEIEARAFPHIYECEDAPEPFDGAVLKAVTDCWKELEEC